MDRPRQSDESPSISRFVDPFESRYQSDGYADLSDYVPSADHPMYSDILRELIRVDLELGWESGRRKVLDDYLKSYPTLVDDHESLNELAFEEYRLRQIAGENPSVDEYRERFGLDPDSWSASALSDWKYEGPDQLSSNVGLARAAESFLCGIAPQTPGPFDELLCSLDPRTASEIAQAARSFPNIGDDIAGFRLLFELGRGAFARVYLAQQLDLAKRLVVLKVSPDIWNESQMLAQLQHSHIVPIYSVHRTKTHQAVCMPYLGSTTLADVIKALKGASDTLTGASIGQLIRSRTQATRLREQEVLGTRQTDSTHQRMTFEDMSYLEAVLWMVARLADGLGQAHARKILHRDIKPANVLLSDDGLPLLLDFNLSFDSKIPASTAALVGGTLPYMAPEQLRAFQKQKPLSEPGSDVYSLGVILYELLTLRPPFPIRRGPEKEVLSEMLDDRTRFPEMSRSACPLSAAVESIVRKCLETLPSKRYQSAHQLRDDLDRHLADLTLLHAPNRSLTERMAKWRRRNPRAMIAVVIATMMLAAWGYYEYRQGARAIELQEWKAKSALETFDQHLKQARYVGYSTLNKSPEEFRKHCNSALAVFQVQTNPAWWLAPPFATLPTHEQTRVKTDIAELLVLLAEVHMETDKDYKLGMKLNQQAEALLEHPTCSILWQRTFLRVRQNPKGRFEPPTETKCIMAYDFYEAGQRCREPQERIRLLLKGLRQANNSYQLQIAAGRAYEFVCDFDTAKQHYEAASRLHPGGWDAVSHIASLAIQQHQFPIALQILNNQQWDSDPPPGIHMYRARCYLEVGDFKAALQSAKKLVDLEGAFPNYYLLAYCAKKAGDDDESDRAFATAEKMNEEIGQKTISWQILTLAEHDRESAADLLVSQIDRLGADPVILQFLCDNGRYASAERYADRVISFNQHDPLGYAFRALARAGQQKLNALDDVEKVTSGQEHAYALFVSACAYARMTPPRKLAAVELIRRSYQNKTYLKARINCDHLSSLHSMLEFQEIRKKIETTPM